MSWEYRRPTHWPTAHDVPSISQILNPVFAELDQEIVAYVHGSYARGLNTNSSDVNLYIPSHVRERIEGSWSESRLRRPSYEHPDGGETIEVHLRDLLGKEVTLCCSGDPWEWVEDDVQVQVYPNLAADWEQVRVRCDDDRSRLLQRARKCWYIVRRFESDDAWKWKAYEQGNVSGGTLRDARGPGCSEDRFSVVHAIFQVSGRLKGISKMDWRALAPELLDAVSVAARFAQLSGECYQACYVRKDKPRDLWESFAHRFRTYKKAIYGLEWVVLA